MRRIDRSRFARQHKHCARARYLGYDFRGIGLRPKAESLPLATGTAIHKPITDALAILKETGELPNREQFRILVAAAIKTYRAGVAARGFDDVAQADVGYVAGEQGALIEGLCWAGYRVLLPWIEQEFRVLAVEQEEEFLAAPDLIMMSRPDAVLERKSDGEVGIVDLKTGSYAPDAQHGEEHILQIAFGTLGVEQRIQRPVNHYYIFSLIKGKRDYAGKADREDGGVRKQNSPLCYGWFREADPPFDKETWKWEYTREKGFSKVPTWLSPRLQGQAGVAGMSVAELVVMELMDQETVEGMVAMSPPWQRPDHLIKGLVKQVVAQEREWEYKVQAVEAGADIDEMIPQSWDCRSFYGRACEFAAVCKKSEAGWEEPQGMGRFVARVGHHAPEAKLFDKGRAAALGFQMAAEDEEGGYAGE